MSIVERITAALAHWRRVPAVAPPAAPLPHPYRVAAEAPREVAAVVAPVAVPVVTPPLVVPAAPPKPQTPEEAEASRRMVNAFWEQQRQQELERAFRRALRPRRRSGGWGSW